MKVKIFWFTVRIGESTEQQPFVKTPGGQFKPYDGGLSAAKAPKFDGKKNRSAYPNQGHLSSGMKSTDHNGHGQG